MIVAGQHMRPEESNIDKVISIIVETFIILPK